MMLLAVFKKVQYKLLMHRLAQMNVRFALMNSKKCINSHQKLPHILLCFELTNNLGAFLIVVLLLH